MSQPNKLMFLSVQERQIFATTKMRGTSAVGTSAIFTNIGIFLHHGAIANDGVHYLRDEDLPQATDPRQNQNYALRAFKRLCANGVDDDDLNDFPIYFSKFENSTDGKVAWASVSNVLEKTIEGREFVRRYNFRVLALINMKSGYGITYDPRDRTGNLSDGHVLHDEKNDVLILDADGKRTRSRPINQSIIHS